MNVRWNAVLIGVAVDLTLTVLLQLLALLFGVNVGEDVFSFQRPSDVVMVVLGVLATGVGGYVAGAVAHEAGVVNGLMVGVVDIVLQAFQRFAPAGTTGAQVDVLIQLVCCLAGALGGYLSRYRAAVR